ncbi:MAG: hypothetical protein J5993_03845 [Clostridia bacterium]|nr:hypothetical protein [Clostridia bacterium]
MNYQLFFRSQCNRCRCDNTLIVRSTCSNRCGSDRCCNHSCGCSSGCACNTISGFGTFQNDDCNTINPLNFDGNGFDDYYARQFGLGNRDRNNDRCCHCRNSCWRCDND